MKVRNVSTLGDLHVPGVGVVKAGESFEVPDVLGKRLLEQPANWEQEKGAAK